MQKNKKAGGGLRGEERAWENDKIFWLLLVYLSAGASSCKACGSGSYSGSVGVLGVAGRFSAWARVDKWLDVPMAFKLWGCGAKHKENRARSPTIKWFSSFAYAVQLETENNRVRGRWSAPVSFICFIWVFKWTWALLLSKTIYLKYI